MSWKDYLPPYRDYPVEPYGSISPKVLVIHKTTGDKDDGADAAAYCRNHPEGYRWHWTVGYDGTAWKHAEFNDLMAHAAGINSLSVGIENDLGSGDAPSEAMLEATASIAAAFCHFIGRTPDRDFIIGHVEDDLATRDGSPGDEWTRWGGDSSHTDPRPAWDWDDFMRRVQAHYKGGSDMSQEFDDYDAGWDAFVAGKDLDPAWNRQKKQGWTHARYAGGNPKPGEPGPHEHPHVHALGNSGREVPVP